MNGVGVLAEGTPERHWGPSPCEDTARGLQTRNSETGSQHTPSAVALILDSQQPELSALSICP